MPEARTWLPDWSHYPEQLTPLSATVWLEAVGLGIHEAMQTLRGPFGGFDARIDGGWAYEGEWDVEWEPVPGAVADAGRELPERWERELRPRSEEITTELRRLRPERPDRAGALGSFDRMWEIVREQWTIHFLAVLPAQALMYETVERLVASGVPDELAAYGVLDGPNDSTEADAMVENLARRAAELGLGEVVTEYPPRLALERLAELEDGREWLGDLRGYLARFGGRSRLHELSLPREAEQPWMTLDAIRLLFEAGRPRNVPAPAASPAAVPPDLEAMLPAARFCYALKESHVYHLDYPGLQATREALLGFGRRLLAEGTLERLDDVWMLRRAEVRGALAGEVDSPGVADLIEAAREEHARGAREGPKPFLGEPPADTEREGFLATFYGGRDGEASGGSLRGTPASSGIGIGPARIVRDGADLGRVRAGDVLVAATTTPAWTPLFGALAGLVTETGGVLSHAAIVAREYGLPAVVGAAGATSGLRDGARIRVDGTAGTVEPAGDVG